MVQKFSPKTTEEVIENHPELELEPIHYQHQKVTKAMSEAEAFDFRETFNALKRLFG